MEDEHGWFNNHHWIFPMRPERFLESGCLKCHFDVTELEPSERFPDPPAPKLMAGYNVIRQFGCFGCHEINGFDGPTRRRGPDIRVEPTYAAAAAEMLADPALNDQERHLASEIVEHPEQKPARKLLAEMLKAEADQSRCRRRREAEPARLTADTLSMADSVGHRRRNARQVSQGRSQPAVCEEQGRRELPDELDSRSDGLPPDDADAASSSASTTICTRSSATSSVARR